MSGEILINGKNAHAYSLDSYRNLFSVVSQDPYLFFGNIAENIDLAETAEYDKIEAAMNISGVTEYLRRMPDGKNTQIGQNGARLSGGEKQKLAVARLCSKMRPL